jgi:helix-turn-helix protein
VLVRVLVLLVAVALLVAAAILVVGNGVHLVVSTRTGGRLLRRRHPRLDGRHLVRHRARYVAQVIDFASALAGRAHRATETLHALVYFVPEAESELTAVGLRPGRMPYFASRAAPMGPVAASVVAATFYNFNPALVAKYIPRAWTLASPDAILAGRLRVIEKSYARLLPQSSHSTAMTELSELLRLATDGLPVEGRPLFAGHASLPWPAEPELALWHGVSLLREFRGDGHIAALLAAQLSGLEAIVTHTATRRGFVPDVARSLRGWSAEEWAAATEGLQARGLMVGDGLTDAGRTLRADLEAETDRLDRAAWLRLGEARTLRVIELGKQLSRAALAAGAIPPGVFAGS